MMFSKNTQSGFLAPAVILGVLLLLLVGIMGWRFVSLTNKTVAPTVDSPQGSIATKTVDYRASFMIFTNDTVRVFSEGKYHNQSPDAYITSDSTNVVSVKKSNITWQQFFDTLPSPMRVTSECLYTGTGQAFCNSSTNALTFHRNGKSEPNLLQQKIADGDKILISYGKIGADVNKQLDAIPSPR